MRAAVVARPGVVRALPGLVAEAEAALRADLSRPPAPAPVGPGGAGWTPPLHLGSGIPDLPTGRRVLPRGSGWARTPGLGAGILGGPVGVRTAARWGVTSQPSVSKNPTPSVVPGLDLSAWDTIVDSAWQSDAAGLAAAARADGVARPRMGVNAPKVYRYEAQGQAKFGDLDALLGDLVACGAQFFRQPTDADLTWPAAAGSGADPAAATIPVLSVAGGAPFDPRDPTQLEAAVSAVYTQIAASVGDPLRAVYEKLGTGTGEYDLKVFLTVFSLAHQWTERFADPLGEYQASTAVGLVWADGHWPNDGGTDFPAVYWWDGTPADIRGAELSPSGGSGALAAWDEGARNWAVLTMDGRSYYKLVHYYVMARALGRVLATLESELVGRVSARTHCVEVINELNRSNQCLTVEDELDWDHSALYWAWIVREVARGFQDELRGTSLEGVSLRLPSLAAYRTDAVYAPAEGTDGQSFGDIVTFQGALCGYLDALLPEAVGSATPVELGWFTGQDYHWYHYRLAECGVPIAWLVAEVAALNTNLDSSLTHADWGAVRVTVCETGATASVDESAAVAGTLYFPAAVQGVPDPDAMAAFQAREVLRRLAVGAAIGTLDVAWLTHLSAEQSSWPACGLREDETADSFASASAANERPSWFTMGQVARLFGLSGGGFGEPGNGAIATLERPDTSGFSYDRSTGGWVTGWSAPPTAAEALIVVRFEHTRLGRYVYLLMLDPTVGPTGKTGVYSSATLSLSVHSERPATFRQYRAHPDVAELAAGATPAEAFVFPSGALADSALLVMPVNEFLNAAELTLDSTLEPVLLACNTCPLVIS